MNPSSTPGPLLSERDAWQARMEAKSAERQARLARNRAAWRSQDRPVQDAYGRSLSR